MSGAAGDRDVRTVERRNMIRLEKRGIIKRFDLLDTLSFFAFCMSVPLFLPVLEQWRGMTSSVAVSWSFLPSVSFSAALSLAAMFTALAFFVHLPAENGACACEPHYHAAGVGVLCDRLRPA